MNNSLIDKFKNWITLIKISFSGKKRIKLHKSINLSMYEKGYQFKWFNAYSIQIRYQI